MRNPLILEPRPLLPHYVHIEFKVAPADARQQEGRFLYSDYAGLESRVQVICHLLDVLLRLCVVVVQTDVHDPAVRIFHVLIRP